MTRTCWRRWMLTTACALALAAAALPFLAQSLAAPPQGDKYALLVGVREYDKNELRNLPYAEDDVTALADVLRNAGYKRVVLMTQTDGAKQARFLPLAANIRKTLNGILEDRTADDTVLIAFAGHGLQFQGEDENYFCPMDAKLEDKSTLVSLGEVYKALEKSEAGTRLLLADCCRNDPRSDQSRAVDKVKLESVTRPQKAAPPGGVAALFSCSAGEKAFESADLKHGVFFHFVVEGLQGKADLDGDGQVDLDELVRYTKKQVPDYVKEQYGDDVRQMPEQVGKTRGLVALTKVDRAADLKDEYVVPAVGMKLKLILRPGKAGKFLMGSPDADKNAEANEKPQHSVELTRPFYMGVCPVTQAEYVQATGNANPSAFSKKGEFKNYVQGLDTSRFPVEEVSWHDAVAFCAALNKADSKKPAGWEYALPTEAEWEYACRAGTTTAYFFGDDPKKLGDYAWYADNAGGLFGVGGRTHEVGTRDANPWGLYDMYGNVCQWCADRYGKYQNSPIKDPTGADSGDGRVYRNGGIASYSQCYRSAGRNGTSYINGKVPDEHASYLGFRVVLRSAARAP